MISLKEFYALMKADLVTGITWIVFGMLSFLFLFVIVYTAAKSILIK